MLKGAGLLLAAVVVIASLIVAPSTAGAQDDPEMELVERHAPILAVRPQSEPCDTSAEQYAPAPAEIVLDNPHILLRQIGVGNPVVMAGPTARDVFDMGQGFYLDFPGDAFDPDCLYEQDYLRYNDGRNALVYAHIATQADEPDQLAVQYWFFWYYNKYNNLHEGDWEGIQLLFDVGSVAEALQTPPASIGLSQHFGGEIARWGDDPEAKLELVDGHPVIYPAVGSHASYFTPDLYLGRSGSQGFGCDDTQDASRRLEPDVVLLPDEVTDPDDPLAWLMFEGLWGEQRFGPFSGATGPITKDRWTQPVDWHRTLRSSSVAVPEGSETTTPYINTFCTVVGFGSRQYLTAQQSPVRTGLILITIGLVLFFVTGRTAWDSVPALPIVRRRRLGQMLRSGATFYLRRLRVFTGLAGGYMVVVALGAAASALLAAILTPLGVVGAGIVGLVTVLAQYGWLIIVAAATAHAVDAMDQGRAPGEEPTAVESFRAALGRARTLIPAAVRAAATVIVLALTIVGIPWAVLQYIRYQFAPAIIMIEGQTDPRQALADSSRLTRGRRRWLHTATVVFVLQGLIFLGSAAIGLTVLIVANGLPLWLYSVISSLSSALVIPFATLVILLLYGNAKASADPDPTDPSNPAEVSAPAT